MGEALRSESSDVSWLTRRKPYYPPCYELVILHVLHRENENYFVREASNIQPARQKALVQHQFLGRRP